LEDAYRRESAAEEPAVIPHCRKEISTDEKARRRGVSVYLAIAMGRLVPFDRINETTGDPNDDRKWNRNNPERVSLLNLVSIGLGEVSSASMSRDRPGGMARWAQLGFGRRR
jgi:hypothetical protein